MFSTLYLVAALAVSAPLDLKPTSAAEKQAATCVKACTDCQLACDRCYLHCAWKVLGGDKEHAASMHMCLGCADACRFASSLTAKHNPMACHASECCMKCCSDTATACEKFPDDKSMVECAKACRDCEKVCKAMMTK